MCVNTNSTAPCAQNTPPVSVTFTYMIHYQNTLHVKTNRSAISFVFCVQVNENRTGAKSAQTNSLNYLSDTINIITIAPKFM